ncbi:unnamed protein product, partial [Discosporangium mesarthrocarpum]
QARDYTGALALLEFNRKSGDDDLEDTLLWIGYCAFHLGNYQRSIDAYEELSSLGGHKDNTKVKEVKLFMACCYYYLQLYEKASKRGKQG